MQIETPKIMNILTDHVSIMLPDGTKIEYITDIIHPGMITSLVGGGGKTSTMLTIGRELSSKGHDVIMTTTTRIRPYSIPLPKNLHCVGVLDEKGKLGPVAHPDSLKEHSNYLLIEADGTRGLPIKAPESHEPVITDKTDLVIALVGLTGVGHPICEVGHRIERICQVLDKKPEDIVTEEDVARLILSEQGLRKNVGSRRYAVILNQADGVREQKYGKNIASLLPEDIPCILTTYKI